MPIVLGLKFKLRPCCRRRLAWLLIVVGMLLTVAGLMLFLLDAVRSSVSNPNGDVDQTVEASWAEEEETASLPALVEPGTVDASASAEPSETASENLTTVSEPDYFAGINTSSKGTTFMMADGTVLSEGGVPAFHTVSTITAETGVNPKTNAESDNLIVLMTAIPDREMSVSVLVSLDNAEISGTTPDFVKGIQWTLTYAGGEFKKTARSVTGDGKTVQMASDHFNSRYIGKDGVAEVGFFGPPGTHYYAVMIYDETYCTLIRP